MLSRQIDPGQTVAASFQAPVLFTIAEDLTTMKLEVRVDEADVGQVHEGQRATFTVDAYPGRTFPAMVTRVDVGANASGSTTSGASSASSAGATAGVIAYTAVLSVSNPDLILRPGMTATAAIVTTERENALLVPNAALRWSPERDAAAGGTRAGWTSVLVPRIGRGGRGGAGGRGGGGGREVSIGRGSRQTVYVLGADGTPQPVRVVVGESNGSVTEITGGDLREGQDVITSRLAPGQTQDKSGGARGQGRGGGRGRGGGGQDNSVQPQAPPAAVAAPAARPTTPGQPPAAAAAQPPPTATRGGGGQGGGPFGGRFRNMRPEQRRAYFQSLTPEQRAAMREQRRQWRAAHGGGEDSPPDGQ